MSDKILGYRFSHSSFSNSDIDLPNGEDEIPIDIDE